MRLTAEPQGFTAQRYRITSAGQPIVEIVLPPFGPSTMTPLAGVTYQMRREGAGRALFTMAADGVPAVARATQRHFGSREYEVVIGSDRFVLRGESLMSSAYQLLHGERIVGFLRPGAALRRGVEAEPPENVSLEASVFLVWIVLLLWRRRRTL